MEETQQQRSVFNFFQSFIYFFILLEVYVQCFSFLYNHNPIEQRINEALYKFPVLTSPTYSHIVVFIMVFILGAATRSKKNIDFNASKHFLLPFLLGLIIFVLSLRILLLPFDSYQLKGALYGSAFLLGTLLLHMAISNVSKKIASGLGKDRWNREQESFAQNKKLVTSESTFNLPMQFYHKKRVHRGWININAFRGVMVLGTPGSGKSESVIIPFIKQFLSKGYCMLVYDFKYPDLAQTTYYHYLKNRVNGGPLSGHAFHIINLDGVEGSRRVNPLHSKYIQTLADASETAEALIHALLKTDKSSGSSQFFNQSAINFLAAAIYYFATYQGGKFSTLPHVLAFLSMPYEGIFKTLFSHPELQALLAPFRSAYDNRAFDQLEGQIGTLRINLSRIATKEAFWLFSGDDFDLKLSNPKSVLVIASSPATQSTSSAFYALVLMRITRLINAKGGHPTALVIDEMPTLFLHKIENLMATARSNKVAVVLGLQELPQLYLQYGREIAHTITSVVGTVLSGAVRSRETLEWLEKVSGKIKQETSGVSINRTQTNINLSERMDTLIPAAKIAGLNAGELVGIVARENTTSYGKYQPNVFHCKIALDQEAVEREKNHYKDLPQFYTFGDSNKKRALLLKNMQQIFQEVESTLL